MMVLGWTVQSAARHSRAVIALLALLAGWFAGLPSWAGTIRSVSVMQDRVTIAFDGRVGAASAFLIDGPRRIAVDLDGARPGGTARVDGAVSGIRQGGRSGGARVVLDLSEPVSIGGGTLSGDGRSLTFALQRTDDRGFARAAARGRITFGSPAAAASFAPSAAAATRVAMALPRPTRSAPLPRVEGDPGRPLVVIDAGHGGKDPGALSADGRLREKDLTLQTALAIRDALLASGRVRVALTRDDDRFLILQERYGIARRLGAGLFISIHCDSAGNPDASGATVYTLSEVASDKEAARLAARENKADIIAGVDLGDQTSDISSILIDLAQRETMNASASFARLLGREAKPLMPTKSLFHRMASLVVLKAPDMPSILFETGYISNQNDADFLNSREGREQVAESVKRAVEIHFATRMASR